jgi:hypothetical protein
MVYGQKGISMGSNLAQELANDSLLDEIKLDNAIAIHLQGNHYPPVPLTMVQPCIEAINAYWDEDYDRLIDMPEGVFYRGMSHAPARAVIESHHLNAWC